MVLDVFSTKIVIQNGRTAYPMPGQFDLARTYKIQDGDGRLAGWPDND
jgi:hypothetical protein